MEHFSTLYGKIRQHEQELGAFMNIHGHTIAFNHDHWPVLITHATTTPSQIRNAPDDLAPEVPRTGKGKIPLDVITKLAIPADELISLIELRGITKQLPALHTHPTFKKILEQVKKEPLAQGKEIQVKVFDNNDGTMTIRHSFETPDVSFISDDESIDELPSTPKLEMRRKKADLQPNNMRVRVVTTSPGVHESQITHQFNFRDHPEEYARLKTYLHRQKMSELYRELKRHGVEFSPNKLTKPTVNWLFDEKGEPMQTEEE